MAFVNHSGLNEVAEVNNLIILYPQAIKSPLDPFNPKGCFDWWGYTGVDYASKLGPQMSTVDAMRNHISKSKSMLHAFPQSDM
jgi:poly(3-hydroxybutyrate) depolymerase